MEFILGQPSRFILCTRFTSLTDELSKLTVHDTSVVVISCLTSIVLSLAATQDTKSSIEKATGMLSSVVREVIRSSNGQIKVLIAPCTPRTTQDFATHSRFTQVSCVFVTYLISVVTPLYRSSVV